MNETFENKSKAIQEEMLPTSQLNSNRWNRKTFDNEGVLELAESIKLRGILEPIIVRKMGDCQYEIASGERRWKAAKLLDLKELPCRILDLSDEDVQDMNLIANIQREDIPALDKAGMVRARMQSGNLTQTQIAVQLGKSSDWVSNLLQVLDIPTGLHPMLTDYKLGVRPMQAIAQLPNAMYQKQIVTELQSGAIKPEHVERRANQLENLHKSSLAKRAKKKNKSEVPAQELASPAAPPPITVSTAPPSPALSLAQALKTDVLDRVLPMGNLGEVLRSYAQKATGRSALKWILVAIVVCALYHPVMGFILKPFQGFHPTAVNAVAPTLPAPLAPVRETSSALSALTKIPAPTGLKGELVSGQKIHLTWNAVPGVFGYNVYSAYEDLDFSKETSKPSRETEGIWYPSSGKARYQLAVTAVDADDRESLYSQPISLDMR